MVLFSPTSRGLGEKEEGLGECQEPEQALYAWRGAN